MGNRLLGDNGPLVWESMTPAYFPFITERKYQALRPYARKWYRPVCQNCAAPKAKDHSGGGE